MSHTKQIKLLKVRGSVCVTKLTKRVVASIHCLFFLLGAIVAKG